MFTGIIIAQGQLMAAESDSDNTRLTFSATPELLADAREGDSMAVSGTCLTMLALDHELGHFSADVSNETLSRTRLGGIALGETVNLEPALRASDRLGGHLVSGHVDGMASLLSRTPEGASERFEFQLPERLARYVAEKGSVCIDGVSLTVNGVTEDCFEVCIIPHTLEVTTLGHLRRGDAVNVEVDLVARYIERMLPGGEKRKS